MARAPALSEAVDYDWLGIGIRLGLDRPQHARHLLELIEAQEAPVDGAPSEHSRGGIPATGGAVGPEPVPVNSMILARAAAVASTELANLEPEAKFGWASRLTADDILSLGRVVRDMLAAGSPPDITRGFGLAWDAGVRMPRREVDAMFREFSELEITVGGILAGRDLRASEPAPRPSGLGGLLDVRMFRSHPGESEAAAALKARGEAGQRGLVALWNAWVAMRYRGLIPRPTFELLVHPWVAVVGPLPER